MNAAVFAFTEAGKRTAHRIADGMIASGDAVDLYAPERLAEGDCAAYAGDLTAFVGSIFGSDALIFVGACGIAVRAVAPHLSGKQVDPAVLCVDECARFVIPILSGHIGGANRLAARLASALGATPVVTTATDVNGRFAVDAWAAERDYCIIDMALAKRVSAAILTDDVPFCCDRAAPEMPLPPGLTWTARGPLGICVSIYDKRPFAQTLLLVPKVLRVGIGCRRDTPQAAIDALIDRVFREHHLRIEAVREAATIDVKNDEPGLMRCCRDRGWPVRFYSAEALAAVPGEFEESDFVRQTVGVGNVCARAAAASGGRVIVPKTAADGVTVAVAELEWGIDFG